MLTVRERGETVATLRWIHVRLMETIAAWVPTTPEMEVKLLLGAHVWDVAQHADALGKRTFELRLPLQHSLDPNSSYKDLLARLAGVQPTAERVSVFYDGILVALASRFETYLSRTDRLLDAPTVRILEHIASEQQRMRREAHELVQDLKALAMAANEEAERLLREERAIDTFVVHRFEHPAAVGA